MDKDLKKEFFNYLKNFKDEYEHIRENKSGFGKKKLFNIKAMEDLMGEKSFLKSQYDKLKVSGKDIFGYHYNEIILSFLFIKFVKNKGEIYDRYLTLRNRAIKDSELKTRQDMERKKQAMIDAEKEKTNSDEVNEMDSFSAGDYSYSGPNFLAKDKKNWRNFQKPLNNMKVVSLKDSKYRLDEKALSDLGKNEYNKIVTIEKINGKPLKEYFEKELSETDKDLKIEVLFDTEEDIDNTDNNLVVMNIPLEEVEEYIAEAYEDDVKDKKEAILFFVEVYDYPMFDDLLKDIIFEKISKGEINEHHIDSHHMKINFILNHSDSFDENELNSMSEDEVDALYREVENKAMNLNEEKKHDAEIKLQRLHKETEKLTNDYYKTLNKGVIDMQKNPDKANTFKYDYSEDSLDPEDIKHFNSSKNDEKLALTRGSTPADVDFDEDNPPSKQYLDRLKDQMGEENFKLMIKKAKLRKLAKQNMRNAKTVIKDPEKEAKELGLKDDIPFLKENVKMYSKYKDEVMGTQIKSFILKETKELKEDKKGLIKLVTEGVGNYENDIQKSAMKEMDFFIEESTGSVYYKPKVKNKIQLAESYKKKMDLLMGYNNESSKSNIKNIRKTLNEDKQSNSWFDNYSLSNSENLKVRSLNQNVLDFYKTRDYENSHLIKEDLNKLSSKLFGKDRISLNNYENIVKDKYKDVFNYD